MSMLAERKVKQKLSLNPRGKAWSEDSNKFGQKMLEKMGWSRGKGLGAKEDGITEHVKPSYKNDSKGMGFKETDDQWTDHDTHFNALLQSLSGDVQSERVVEVKSLEEKSQNSKVRVHYKKFTRGKDLSKCSEKDLANIFGKKTLKAMLKHLEEKEEVAEDSESNELMRNGGSMVDYFKKKLAKYGKSNDCDTSSNDTVKTESDTEEASYSGLGFGSAKKRKSNEQVLGTPKKKKKETIDGNQGGLSNPAFDPLFSSVEVRRHVLNTINEESEEVVKKTEKSKVSENVFVNNDDKIHEEINSNEGETKKKKKKKSKDKGDIDEDIDKPKKSKKKVVGLDNPNFNDVHEDDENSEKKRTNEMSDGTPKKIKQGKLCGNEKGLSNPAFNASFDDAEMEELNIMNEGSEEVPSKKNKKKKKEHSKLEKSLDNDSNEEREEISVAETTENKKKKKPKIKEDSSKDVDSLKNSKKNKKKGKEHCEPEKSLDNNSDEEHEEISAGETKESKKKKKPKSKDIDSSKKSKKEALGLDNPNFDNAHEDNVSHSNGNYEVKRKNKRDRLLEENLPVSDDVTSLKKKKKSKQKSSEELAIDNPGFQDISNDRTNVDVSVENEKPHNDELGCDLILNVASIPIKEKSNSVKSKQSSSKQRKRIKFSDVTDQRIIPSREDVINRNELFDINSKVIENGLKSTNRDKANLDENIDEISKKIEGFQAEIENDINEAKAVKVSGTQEKRAQELNEKVPEGTKLKFRYATFGPVPPYMRRATGPKSSYKHLIRGDIIVCFKNTNLHTIDGYGYVKGKNLVLRNNSAVQRRNDVIKQKNFLVVKRNDSIQNNYIVNRLNVHQRKNNAIQKRNDIIQRRNDVIQRRNDVIQRNNHVGIKSYAFPATNYGVNKRNYAFPTTNYVVNRKKYAFPTTNNYVVNKRNNAFPTTNYVNRRNDAFQKTNYVNRRHDLAQGNNYVDTNYDAIDGNNYVNTNYDGIEENNYVDTNYEAIEGNNYVDTNYDGIEENNYVDTNYDAIEGNNYVDANYDGIEENNYVDTNYDAVQGNNYVNTSYDEGCYFNTSNDGFQGNNYVNTRNDALQENNYINTNNDGFQENNYVNKRNDAFQGNNYVNRRNNSFQGNNYVNRRSDTFQENHYHNTSNEAFQRNNRSFY